MEIKKEKVAEIINKDYKWSTVIHFPENMNMVADDIIEVMDFLHDLFNAEADAIRENEPWATHTIDELEKVAFFLSINASEVGDLLRDVKL